MNFNHEKQNITGKSFKSVSLLNYSCGGILGPILYFFFGFYYWMLKNSEAQCL